jgi:hypothetical protein
MFSIEKLEIVVSRHKDARNSERSDSHMGTINMLNQGNRSDE